jgi:hypothetical protein
MRREQRVDRIIGDERTCHEPARAQGIAKHPAPEDREQWRLHLTLLGTLPLAVFKPNRRLLDEEADVDD